MADVERDEFNPTSPRESRWVIRLHRAQFLLKRRLLWSSNRAGWAVLRDRWWSWCVESMMVSLDYYLAGT